jgi:GEVED domain
MLIPKLRVLILAVLACLSGQLRGQYCNPTGYIDGPVRFSQINWVAGKINLPTGGYHNLTATDSLKVFAGFSYPITFVMASAGAFPANVCSFWVDWNQDSIFTDSTERVNLTSTDFGYTFKGLIKPTPQAKNGLTRLRAVVFYTAANRTMNPCASSVPNNDGSVIDLGIIYRTAPQTVPGCTRLVSPANGLNGQVNPLNFVWKSASLQDAPLGYKLYLDTLASFPNAPITLTDTTYTAPKDLKLGKKYFWKVIPFNAAGDAIACNTQTVNMLGLVPNCPIVHYPNWGGPVINKTVRFAWSGAGGNPDRYRIMLDTLYPPNKILADSLTGNNYTTNPLLGNSMYYYKIQSHNLNGWSECVADSFITTDSVTYCTTSRVRANFRVEDLTFANLHDTGVASSGYFNKKMLVANLQLGKPDTLISTANYNFSVTTVNVYIDWNHNGILTDTGEIYRTNRNGAKNSIVITPPANAVLGNTLMRLVMVFLAGPRVVAPCGAFGYDGNSIDYTVNLGLPNGCNTSPYAGFAHVDSVNCATGRQVIVSRGELLGPCYKANWQYYNDTTWVTTPDSATSLVLAATNKPVAWRYLVSDRNNARNADSTRAILVLPPTLPVPEANNVVRCNPGKFRISVLNPQQGLRTLWFKNAIGNNADSLFSEPIGSDSLIANIANADSLIRYVAFVNAYGCLSARVRVKAQSIGIPEKPVITSARGFVICLGDSLTLSGPTAAGYLI